MNRRYTEKFKNLDLGPKNAPLRRNKIFPNFMQKSQKRNKPILKKWCCKRIDGRKNGQSWIHRALRQNWRSSKHHARPIDTNIEIKIDIE